MSVKTYSYAKDGNEFITDHFQVKEFQCHNGADKILINDDLCKLFERLFELFNLGFVNIYSGYRTPEYSPTVGGYSTDQHTKGNAADIICYDKNHKVISTKKICCGLQLLGHNGGIGYHGSGVNTVHVDVRGTKTWFDESKNNATVSSWTNYFNMPLPGDTNLDGKITADDARLALRASAQLENISAKQIQAADMDSDGKVSAPDSRIILRVSAGLI